MFEIIVNGQTIKLLHPASKVNSLVIKHMRGVPIPIQATHTKAIAEWLYNLTQEVDLIEYNGTLMDKASINKPKHMKGN